MERPEFCNKGHDMTTYGHLRKRGDWGCYKCAKTYTLSYRYGITEDQLQMMIDEQNNKCPMCDREFGGSDGRVPCVDHDHSCCPGRISCGKCLRGILCKRCNSLLGSVDDNETFFENGLQYLRSYK